VQEKLIIKIELMNNINLFSIFSSFNLIFYTLKLKYLRLNPNAVRVFYVNDGKGKSTLPMPSCKLRMAL